MKKRFICVFFHFTCDEEKHEYWSVLFELWKKCEQNKFLMRLKINDVRQLYRRNLPPATIM